MVPSTYHDFFMASVGAGAALVGLLFVAVSIFPERIVGSSADSERQAEATNAFSALLNAFFISLGALIPGIEVGILVLVMGAFSLLNTFALSAAIWRAYRAKQGRLWTRERVSSAGLILGSFYIYGAEIWWGYESITGKGPLSVAYIASLLMFSFGLALVRAWALLGARRNSIGDLIGAIVQGASNAAHITHENQSDRTQNGAMHETATATAPTTSAAPTPTPTAPVAASTMEAAQAGETQ